MSDRIKPIVMPKWGLAMQEGMVAQWLVDEGAEIAAGHEILDLETSKIANVYESPVAGPLRRRVVGEGETVPVGALLGVVADASVADAEIDAFVAQFQEAFAAHAAEAAEVPPEPQVIEAGGQRIRYLELGEGEGPPIVFIHGFGGDLNNWQYNQEDLSAEHRTVALDLPGHGGSTKEVGEGDIGGFAATVLGFLDAKDMERAHFVGHSLGGAVALHIAYNRPERAASLTLICPASLGPEINMDYINGFLEARRRKQMQPVLEMLVADAAMVSREMIEDVLRFKRLDGVDQALRTVVDAVFPNGRQVVDLRNELIDVAVPVQVIWGLEDEIVPAEHAKGVPGNVQVHLLERAGHMAHIEKAAEVNELIRRQVRS